MNLVVAGATIIVERKVIKFSHETEKGKYSETLAKVSIVLFLFIFFGLMRTILSPNYHKI